MCDDPLIVRLYFVWAEVQKLYDELKIAIAAQPLYGEEFCEKGFWLFGGNPVFLMTNAANWQQDGKEKAEKLAVNAHNYDPTKIEDSSYWEDPLLPIIKDHSPVFIDAYELLRIAENPSEPGMTPQFLCIDLKKNSITPSIMFTGTTDNVFHFNA